MTCFSSSRWLIRSFCRDAGRGKGDKGTKRWRRRYIRGVCGNRSTSCSYIVSPGHTPDPKEMPRSHPVRMKFRRCSASAEMSPRWSNTSRPHSRFARPEKCRYSHPGRFASRNFRRVSDALATFLTRHRGAAIDRSTLIESRYRSNWTVRLLARGERLKNFFLYNRIHQ